MRLGFSSSSLGDRVFVYVVLLSATEVEDETWFPVCFFGGGSH